MHHKQLLNVEQVANIPYMSMFCRRSFGCLSTNSRRIVADDFSCRRLAPFLRSARNFGAQNLTYIAVPNRLELQ